MVLRVIKNICTECSEVAEANVFCLLCRCFWSLQQSFCQAMTATWFSVVPSLLVPSIALPLHFGLLKLTMASTPWPLRAKFMKETRRFHLELIGSQINVPKTTLDLWYLKMIRTEFSISMPTDATSVVMQLTCHSANHSLLHARFMVLHVVQGETEFSKDCTYLHSSQNNSRRYHLNLNSNFQNSGKGCCSRPVLPTELSVVMK